MKIHQWWPSGLTNPRVWSEQLGTKGLLRSLGAYFGGNSLSLILTVFSSLLVARLAGPENMGYLLTVGAITPYLDFLLLGVNNGLNRELPVSIGQQKHEFAQRLVDAAWGWSVCLGVLVGSLFLIAALVLLYLGMSRLAEVTLAYVAIAPLTILIQNLEVRYRTRQDFLRLSVIRVTTGSIALLSVSLLLLSPWYGLVGRSIIISAMTCLILSSATSHKAHFLLDWDATSTLARTGLPIFSVGYMSGVFDVLDRTLIASLIGISGVGMYTPAVQIAMGLNTLPKTVGHVIYPRMCEKFGRTGDPRDLKVLTFFPAACLAVALLPIFVAGWWLVPTFVRLVLPDYIGGIKAAQWILVTMYLKSVSVPLLIFQTIKKNAILGVILLLSSGVSIGLSMLLYRHGMGLAAIPAGFAGGYLVYLLVGVTIGAWLLQRAPLQKAV